MARVVSSKESSRPGSLEYETGVKVTFGLRVICQGCGAVAHDSRGLKEVADVECSTCGPLVLPDAIPENDARKALERVGRKDYLTVRAKPRSSA